MVKHKTTMKIEPKVMSVAPSATTTEEVNLILLQGQEAGPAIAGKQIAGHNQHRLVHDRDF